ncbi:hypothetical protein GF386_01760 [Candidatus Pacearchaeota archaeon]|nr:hypothetical protein [Candidatus Pacearchaeota archaeon]MBD3282906.1 hypothetical protein [Candidatus Pacearchaeota archaeon]
MKKRGYFLLLVFLLIQLSISSSTAQVPQAPGMPGVSGEIDEETGLPEEFAKFQKISENLTDDEIRAEYLRQQWEKIIENNLVMSAVHNTFQEIDIVFVVLFGMHYEISLTLFFVILLWIIIALKMPDIIKSLTKLSTLPSFAIAMGIPIILAQIQVLRYFAELLVKFLFYQEAALARFFAAIVIFLVIIIIYALEEQIAEYLKQKEEQKEKEEEKFHRKILKKIVEAISGR